MRILSLLILIFSLPAALASVPAAEPDDAQTYIEWAREFWQSLTPRHGEFTLSGGEATITVPDGFYYLDAKDSQRVLEEAWSNPPTPSIQGMIFPQGQTPFHETAWAVTIEYEADGYVADDDAESIDYGQMLLDLKAATEEGNAARREAGFEAVHLVGWAAPPHYNKETHKLYWARELAFDGIDANTLNYNIRVLGRKGVLVMNFVAGMNQLPEIEQNVEAVLDMAEFNLGYRYSEFDPDLDEVAAYGIGALIAGKVAAKAGLFAAALVLLKKFLIPIVLGAGYLLMRLLRRKKQAEPG